MDAIKEAMIRAEDTGYHDARLDPYIGATTPQTLMWELRLSVIICECDTIARKTDMLAWLRGKNASAALAQYDLRKSAQALRDAASRLDDLLGKQAQLEAAE